MEILLTHLPKLSQLNIMINYPATYQCSEILVCMYHWLHYQVNGVRAIKQLGHIYQLLFK